MLRRNINPEFRSYIKRVEIENMKIYFAGSIRGGRDDIDYYREIINHLKNFGKVLTEHIGDNNSIAKDAQNLSDKKIHSRDLKWLLEAEVLIAEVTNPSLGVGYEIGRAVEHKKSILCLYRNDGDRPLSAMIAGCDNLVFKNYSTLAEARQIITDFLS